MSRKRGGRRSGQQNVEMGMSKGWEGDCEAGSTVGAWREGLLTLSLEKG